MERDDIQATLRELRELYATAMEAAPGVDALAGAAVDREIAVDFWKLSGAELEREMWKRLSILDADADCLPGGPIRSHRPRLGKAIVFAKKVLRRLLAPYSSMLLQKQNQLNRELVTFQLLGFLRLRLLDRKIRALEDRLADLPESIPADAENGAP
jgi:hypothetical protein